MPHTRKQRGGAVGKARASRRSHRGDRDDDAACHRLTTHAQDGSNCRQVALANVLQLPRVPDAHDLQPALKALYRQSFPAELERMSSRHGAMWTMGGDGYTALMSVFLEANLPTDRGHSALFIMSSDAHGGEARTEFHLSIESAPRRWGLRGGLGVLAVPEASHRDEGDGDAVAGVADTSGVGFTYWSVGHCESCVAVHSTADGGGTQAAAVGAGGQQQTQWFQVSQSTPTRISPSSAAHLAEARDGALGVCLVLPRASTRTLERCVRGSLVDWATPLAAAGDDDGDDGDAARSAIDVAAASGAGDDRERDSGRVAGYDADAGEEETLESLTADHLEALCHDALLVLRLRDRLGVLSDKHRRVMQESFGCVGVAVHGREAESTSPTAAAASVEAAPWVFDGDVDVDASDADDAPVEADDDVEGTARRVGASAALASDDEAATTTSRADVDFIQTLIDAAVSHESDLDDNMAGPAAGPAAAAAAVVPAFKSKKQLRQEKRAAKQRAAAAAAATLKLTATGRAAGGRPAGAGGHNAGLGGEAAAEVEMGGDLDVRSLRASDKTALRRQHKRRAGVNPRGTE